jgi:hypothetical protein
MQCIGAAATAERGNLAIRRATNRSEKKDLKPWFVALGGMFAQVSHHSDDIFGDETPDRAAGIDADRDLTGRIEQGQQRSTRLA